MQLICPEPKEAQIAHLQTEHSDNMYQYLFSSTGGLTCCTVVLTDYFFFCLVLAAGSQSAYDNENFSTCAG